MIGRAPGRGSAEGRRRFKRRQVGLADGGRLVLDIDGSIRRVDDRGDTTRAWTTDDPEWPREALRFGIHPQAATVAPHRRFIPGTRPPRW
jgi:hypothetical protein